MFRCIGIIVYYSAKATKIINVTNSVTSVNYNVYAIVTADDKIQSIKRCELPAVVITVHGSC